MSVACYLSFTGELLWEIRWSTERRCGVVSCALSLYALSALPAEEGCRAASAILQRVSKTEEDIRQPRFFQTLSETLLPSIRLRAACLRLVSDLCRPVCTLPAQFQARFLFIHDTCFARVPGPDCLPEWAMTLMLVLTGGRGSRGKEACLQTLQAVHGVKFNMFERMVFSQSRWGSLRLDSRVCRLRPRESSSGWFKAIPTVVRPLCLR